MFGKETENSGSCLDQIQNANQAVKIIGIK